MRKIDVSKMLFIISCVVLIFIYGVVVGRYYIFPYYMLRSLKFNVVEVFDDVWTLAGLRPTHFLQPARYDGDGVLRFRQGQAAPGLTFITSFFDGANEMRLLRLDGTVVQRWPVRYSDFFPDPKHIRPKYRIPNTDWNIDLHGSLILPDGSVVFNFEHGGMVKIDRCGTEQWTVPRETHHSIDRAADGGFWVPGRRYGETESAFSLDEKPYYEDTILKISADGKVLTEISVPALFVKNNLYPVLLVKNWHMENKTIFELVHLNDVEELSADLADRFPQFDAGDLVVSLRDLNLIMVIDPTTQKVKWYQTGPWLRQHDPDFQADGTITVFNNNNDKTKTGSIFGGSNIIQLDMNNFESKILYGDKKDQKWFSAVRGKHQILENGNILIAETEAGRVFEVTDKGDIIWEFINRFNDEYVAEVTGAIRYPESYFTVDDWSCK